MGRTEHDWAELSKTWAGTVMGNVGNGLGVRWDGQGCAGNVLSPPWAGQGLVRPWDGTVMAALAMGWAGHGQV